jgi:hypothetical protein
MMVAALFAPLITAQQMVIPSIPTWGRYLDDRVTVMIPLKEEGSPYRVEGRIVDSSDTVVREFTQKGVDKAVFIQTLPPFETGTYHLAVTITDKTGAVRKLDHFPPLTVAAR